MITFLDQSVFRTASGEFYSVEVVGDEARSLMADRIKEADKTEPLCLEIWFEGELLDQEDFISRKIVAIESLDHIRSVACP